VLSRAGRLCVAATRPQRLGSAVADFALSPVLAALGLLFAARLSLLEVGLQPVLLLLALAVSAADQRRSCP
jgi:hypothetical protein